MSRCEGEALAAGPGKEEVTAMQKADIARHIHQQAGISERQAASLLDWILELLKTTLQKGEPIAIPGFGKFTVRAKASRTGRNFKTGEALIITARRVVTFHPSLVLKAEVNGVRARTLQ
jgi:integration host factor subunit alpha